MKFACVSCSKSANLIVIPGNESLYICRNCLSSIKSSSNWNKEDIPSSNSICKLCLSNSPSFIDITTDPFRKLCYHCASKITKTGTKMFINVKWETIIRSPLDLEKYNFFKANFKAMYESFNKHFTQLEAEKTRINDAKSDLLAVVDRVFKKKIDSIENYKTELWNLFCNLKNEAKDDIYSGKIGNSRSKGAQLFKSSRDRKLLADKQVCENVINTKDYEKTVDQLCTLSFLSTNELFHSNSLLVFIPKVNPMFEIYADTLTCDEILVDSKKFAWKYQAAWCTYDNEDIFYCGGQLNELISKEVYLITKERTITKLADCSPKKNHCLCLNDNLVYSICGNNDIVERYIKCTNTWERLKSPPESLGACSVVSIGKSLLIAPFKRKDFYFYYIEHNYYEKVQNLPFTSNCSKLLLREKDTLYCLSKNKVYTSGLDAKTWVVVNEKNPNVDWCSLGTPLFTEKKFYFVLDDFALFSFSTVDNVAKGLKINKT